MTMKKLKKTDVKEVDIGNLEVEDIEENFQNVSY